MGNKQAKAELPSSIAACVANANSGPVENKKDEDLLLLKRAMKDATLLATVTDQLSDGCNALHKAAEKNRKDLLEVLLTETDKYQLPPADRFIDAKKAGGSTPLHVAAIRGFDDVAEALLKFGANPAAVNENNQTPLDFCIHNLDLSDDKGGSKKRRSEAKDKIAVMLKGQIGSG